MNWLSGLSCSDQGCRLPLDPCRSAWWTRSYDPQPIISTSSALIDKRPKLVRKRDNSAHFGIISCRYSLSFSRTAASVSPILPSHTLLSHRFPYTTVLGGMTSTTSLSGSEASVTVPGEKVQWSVIAIWEEILDLGLNMFELPIEAASTPSSLAYNCW